MTRSLSRFSITVSIVNGHGSALAITWFRLKLHRGSKIATAREVVRGLHICLDDRKVGSTSPRSSISSPGRVVGWSMSATMTAQLVTDALVMAIWRRGKRDALLHHSDRGSQYTSEQFQRLMADHGVVCSMSRSGNVWDSAATESFFSSLKTERTARKLYRTRDEAKADVFDYIERFYNPKRRHSRIGYMSPMEFESQAGLA
jgi:hypothetical protein